MALNQYISVFKKIFLYSFQFYQNNPALGELIKREETAYTNRKTLTNTFNFCSQLIQSKIVVSEQYVCVLSCFSHIQLFVTLWTVAHQAPLSMEFSRQEYLSGLSCPPPGDLPNPGI